MRRDWLRAGPEISVAATKSFIAQLIVLYWLIIRQGKFNIRQRDGFFLELKGLSGKVQRLLDNDDAVKEYAEYLSRFEDVFFIGRGLNYPVALEGALKLKEVSVHPRGRICRRGIQARRLCAVGQKDPGGRYRHTGCDLSKHDNHAEGD